jgi:Tfp pilus assembly protein PilO
MRGPSAAHANGRDAVNLTIKSFRPAPTVTKQLHAEWPINLELDGTYHNLALFFDRVGKFTRAS